MTTALGGRLTLAALVALGMATWRVAGAAPAPAAPSDIARGRYLVTFGGCNDCHTPGWRESDGAVPLSRWMTGSPIGFRGAWGTSYPTNVRLDFAVMPEDQWLLAVRTRAGHPPMVWHDIRVLTDADARAIYDFIVSLGPAGAPAPASLPPWRRATTRVIETRPQP